MNEASPIPATQATHEDNKTTRSLNFSPLIEDLEPEGHTTFTKGELIRISNSPRALFNHETLGSLQVAEIKKGAGRKV